MKKMQLMNYPIINSNDIAYQYFKIEKENQLSRGYNIPDEYNLKKYKNE